MRYFFVSGFVGGNPFDVAVRSENGYPQRSDLVRFVKEKTSSNGVVSFSNIIEMNPEDYDSWEFN